MARYINHTTIAAPPPANPSQEIIASLTNIVTGFPPRNTYRKHDLQGLYSGPTSIAYLFFHLSKSSPDLLIAERKADYWCHRYLSHSHPEIPVRPSRCGVANETLAYLSVGAVAGQGGNFVDLILGFVPALLAENVEGASNEWLYGRAGTLYLLRLMRAYTPPNTRLDEAITAIIDKVLEEGPTWFWHGKEYLGAVHGSIGILTQIVLSEPARAAQIKGLLGESIAAQSPETGNWPSSAESGREHLVQFCHGASGFVVSLLATRQYYTHDLEFSETINEAIKRGRWCIYERGLLTKESCLCHGATGNAVALEGESREGLLQWCQRTVVEQGLKDGVFVRSDDAWGLFCGEAGRAWGWMVVEGLGEGMVGYSDV